MLINKETAFNSLESINIENSEKVSKYAKTEMKNKTESNNNNIKDSDSKFIIKIPKPFALGYININLSKLLSGLLKGLSAALIAIVISKISDLLLEKLLEKIERNDLTETDINNAINDINVNSIINDAKIELNNKTQDNNILTINTDTKSDNKIKDNYIRSNKNKKNISNKSKYTIDKRNRKDILESDAVNKRNGNLNTNIKIIKNPNYGNYVD